MFENLPNQPEDIFAKTDSAAPQVAPPTMPSAPSVSPTPSVQPIQEIQENVSPKGGHFKTIVIVAAIIVVIVGAFLISWRILTSRVPVTPQGPSEKANVEQTEQPSAATIPEQALQPEVIQSDLDSDKDGLTDAQEAQLGTSPKSSDTDGDGLFDLEELETYGTNPLNQDTDGDGYLDGNEVKAGYDPNGPGKLIEVPTSS